MCIFFSTFYAYCGTHGKDGQAAQSSTTTEPHFCYYLPPESLLFIFFGKEAATGHQLFFFLVHAGGLMVQRIYRKACRIENQGKWTLNQSVGSSNLRGAGERLRAPTIYIINMFFAVSGVALFIV
jgi:hypothetical protein